MTTFVKNKNSGSTWTGYGDDVIVHFRTKSLFFLDTRDHQEYDTKKRLSISGPSFSEVLAEVESVKRKLTLAL